MTWTCTMAAKEFGVSRETVIRGLRGLGHEPKQNDKFTTRDVHRALAGDLKAERARDTRASADRREMENALLRKELVRLDEVLDIITERFVLPAVQWLDDFPERTAKMCNDSHPEIAKLALIQGTDEFKLVLKTSIEKICSPHNKNDE